MNITPDMIDYDYYGDKATVTVEGKSYKIEFAPDYDSNVDDTDCYNEEGIAAWRNDEWNFIAISVTPLDVPERAQFALSDSLCGLEYNFPLATKQVHNGRPYNSTNTDYQLMVHPVPDMIDEVASKVKLWEETQGYLNHVFG